MYIYIYIYIHIYVHIILYHIQPPALPSPLQPGLRRSPSAVAPVCVHAHEMSWCIS